MGKKRKKNPSAHHSNQSADFNNPSKRSRQSDDPSNLVNDFRAPGGYIDATTGQRGAFPGLNNNDDFYGPAVDGMDYLRMVRSEAKHVPQLLIGKCSTAPPPPKAQPSKKRRRLPPPPPPRDDTVLDYDDPPYQPPTSQDDVVLNYDEPLDAFAAPDTGTTIEAGTDGETLSYDEPVHPTPVEEQQETATASPTSPPDTPEQDSDPTSFFYDGFGTYTSHRPSLPAPPLPPWQISLLVRFRDIRSILHNTPPPPTSNHMPLPAGFRRAFRNHVDANPASTAALWKLNQQTTLTALEWMTHFLIHKRRLQRGLPRYWGGWIWGLLVRVDDCLSADEVVIVRELGKAALEILRQGSEWKKEHANDAEIAEVENLQTKEEGDKNGETKKEDEASDSEGEDDKEEGEVDKEEARESLSALQRKLPLALEADSLAVFEMIVAVVGEFFGQKDLLEKRTALQL